MATGQSILAGTGRAAHALPQWQRWGGPSPIIWIPALLIGLAMLLPLAYLIIRSSSASQDAWALLVRPRTAYILGRSILLVATVTVISTAIAVPIAWLTTRTDLPFRKFLFVLSMLPLVIPSYVGAFLAISALGPKGLLQQLMEVPFGVERLPDIYGLPGATITLALLSYPYILLTVRSALKSLDPSLEEAARSLGHGSISTILRITLPQLRPAIAAGALLVALYTLSDFGAVSLMQYETFTWAIYQQYQSAFDRSIASALSLVLVVLAITILVMESHTRGRMRYYRVGAGAARESRLVKLGWMRWPAVAFSSSVIVAALVLPMAVLMFWLVRGMLAGESLLLLWSAARNSLYVSGIAAVVAALTAIPVAALVVRHPGIFSYVLERASFVGYALPGVVVALALVFFGANYVRPIYQTSWLLVFAYVVLFFPVALGAVRTSLLQISPRLEDAARGLRKTPAQVLISINIPLMRSGVLMGAALVFLVSMKELPATLILGPLGFNTLARAIWSASSEAFFAQAAAPALMLILMSSLPMAFLVLREKNR